MLRRINLFLNFYSMFAAATLSITVLCAVLLVQLGLQPFVYIFWFKMLTLGVCIYGAYRNRGNRFFYYKNLNIPVPALWVSSVLFDLLIFIGMVVLVIKMS